MKTNYNFVKVVVIYTNINIMFIGGFYIRGKLNDMWFLQSNLVLNTYKAVLFDAMVVITVSWLNIVKFNQTEFVLNHAGGSKKLKLQNPDNTSTCINRKCQ